MRAPADAVQPTTPPQQGRAGIHTLAEGLSGMACVLHAVKARLGAAGDGERAAHVLLFPLVRLGPLRQGALADVVHTDPSTVSRHVALLVRRGLVRRVADEQDGRASLLVVTPDGEAVLEAMHAERTALLEQATADWSPDDLSRFCELLGRFVAGLDCAVPGRAAGATPPAEKDR